MEGETPSPLRPANAEAVEPAKPTKPPKAPKAQKGSKGPKQPKPTAPKKVTAQKEPVVPKDPDSMFKEGFLHDVYNEKPSQSVVTRFPPEPNGYLHIGHSKAIAINFGFAKYRGGECYLRFDDTNPEAEEQKYFDAIEDMIAWLGYKPYKVTYSSDNFDKLYKLANTLIREDGAYICHCTDTEVKLQRGGDKGGPRYACPHRDRPQEESLQEFEAMKNGKYKPREAFLRMKQNLEDGNPQMWDLAAYRILDASHHRTGSTWRIYPTYDFTHCLCDSFEGITHSLCTTEFELSRVSYEWLCDKVKIYKPMQREYGRLNLTGTVLSKRKIMKLVSEKIVRDWDDPRLYTLIALRRRGIPPSAILSFVNELGVTKSGSNIQIARFEQSVRKELDMMVPRVMLVLDPIPVHIEGLEDSDLDLIKDISFHPKNSNHGVRDLIFSKTVYIERSDFREEDDPKYFRLAPGKAVGLLNVKYPIKAIEFKKDPISGLVESITAKYERPERDATFKKPKAYIHWVAESSEHGSPITAEVRIFNRLFKSENPDSAEGGFLSDLNPESEEIYRNAKVEVGFKEVQKKAMQSKADKVATDGSCSDGLESIRFQGMRVAFFCVDNHVDGDRLVLNRIVSLKEDSGKA
ncbi:MAG: hypothetical protein M1814_006343 [Vezdaea aestivalis]|nr:MAG: hypothetical protein M1814_006343 [Vezdaea aestivalis]